MKRVLMLCLLGALVIGAIDVAAQERDTTRRAGRGFVDANGDGFNDNAPDHDGDGIPNGLDPDFRRGMGRRAGRNAPDDDGDGIPNGRDPDFVRPRTRNGAGWGPPWRRAPADTTAPDVKLRAPGRAAPAAPRGAKGG